MEEKEKRLNKGGRPSKSEATKKSKYIKVWLTPIQHEKLVEESKLFKLSLSEYGAKKLMNTAIVSPFTEQELQLKIGLVGMANNLNQLAHKANAGGFLSVEQNCIMLLNEIKKELKRFRE